MIPTAEILPNVRLPSASFAGRTPPCASGMNASGQGLSVFRGELPQVIKSDVRQRNKDRHY